jgi:ABC-type uncharacterized transport system involved in gliding motility auxiliary subunit
MAERVSQPSFEPRRKWRVGFQVVFTTVFVLAVVIMANYLSRDRYRRLFVSSRTRVTLSSQTLSLLRSVTNTIRVTLYYDKQDPFYGSVVDVLNEYQRANPKIVLQSVDYLRQLGQAEKIKADYHLNSASDTNLIIFQCEGRGAKVVPGGLLTDYTYTREMTKRLTGFRGEMMFSAAILAVSSAKPFKACFVTGHGEHALDNRNDGAGYSKLADVLAQNYIASTPLSLLGAEPIPADCQLLVIAGPRTSFFEVEREKVAQYLLRGGRLLMLFNEATIRSETGLEKVLAQWGVDVGANIVVDEEHSSSRDLSDVIISTFSQHPVVKPLISDGIFLIRPRTVGKLTQTPAPIEGVHLEILAATGPNAYVATDPAPSRRALPVAVAVERTPIKDLVTERGSTRMVVVGDSSVFANAQLELLSDRAFATYAVNWLLDRGELLEGVGPKPVSDFRLAMSSRQVKSSRLLLLVVLPGLALAVGGMVWLRRRR